MGLVGAAWGILLAGLIVVNVQIAPESGHDQAFHIIFFGFSGIGAIKLLCSLCLSSNVEPNHSHSYREGYGKLTGESLEEQSSLLAHDNCGKYESFPGLQLDGKAPKGCFPGFAPVSTAFMWRFYSATFLDYVANGIALISWMTYFFRRRYGVSEGTLSLVISIASIFSASVILISSPLARHIGPVPAMVLCHSLNSISLLTVSVPKCKAVALGLFMSRILTRELDSAPRLSFVAASVRERTK